MLNKNFRYVALDFETTGLDPKKDEAIQIWLVEVDIYWKVIKEFKSFLKPQKDIKELRDLVSYITGISLKDLELAPSIFDLQNDIKEFFGDNVILIWQNIQFDIDFIHKYLPYIKYYDSIDTMYMAQNLVHFAPSYALDVLVEYLMTKKEFKKIFNTIHGQKEFDVENAHDALFDSKNAICLFVYVIQDIISLIKSYPVLSNFVKKNTWLYHKILDLQVDRAWKKIGKVALPALEKQLPSNVSLNSKFKIDLNDFKNKDRYFVGNVDIRELIGAITSSNKNVILSFSSVAKLNIVKNILSELWVKNIGFVRWWLIINKTRFNTFLNKDNFGDNEFLFVIKYMSHLRYNMSILDLNTKFDYKINYYIQDDSKNKNYPIVLSTHGGLFSILEDKNHVYKNYDVCFFDSEMWYKSYNSFLSRPVDLYTILNFLESLYYKYTLDNNINWKEVLENFARFFEVFMWVLFSETKKHFVDIQNNYITLNPILDHINFYETNNLLKQLEKHQLLLENNLDSIDFDRIWSKIEHMLAVLSWLVQVNKVMYGQSDFYFVYSEANKFTNWDEFTDIFNSHTLFFSTYDKTYNALVSDRDLEINFDIKKISNIDKIVDYLDEIFKKELEKKCFVISTVKHESKELFQKMYAKWLDQRSSLLIENITWSLGKNIFKAKSSWSKILVWGYNFIMWTLSNNINIDICLDFNIKWKMSNYLLYDIKRYAQSHKK
jgi:DNA polymerase III epsilon subunit-like protein